MLPQDTCSKDNQQTAV